jgi:hypothetical protein
MASGEVALRASRAFGLNPQSVFVVSIVRGKSLHWSINSAEQSLVAHTNQHRPVKMNDNESAWIKKEEALSKLIGARLTSVQFILSYLILGFDEKGALTTLVWPEICYEGKNFTFGTQGYRDELCSLIEKVAKNVTMEVDETISIDFENGVELRIPLRSYKAPGERAILTGPKRYLFVL